MGAHNSTPQTVRLDNPQQNLAIQVTPSVVSRLMTKEEQSQKNAECEKCKELKKRIEQQEMQSQFSYRGVQQTPKNWTQAQDVFQKKYNELEEYQFDKTVQNVEALIGKPLTWVDDVYETITTLRQDLIKCYNDNPEQTLNCANAAKQYQQFIQQEQLKSILNFNGLAEKMPEEETDEPIQ